MVKIHYVHEYVFANKHATYEKKNVSNILCNKRMINDTIIYNYTSLDEIFQTNINAYIKCNYFEVVNLLNNIFRWIDIPLFSTSLS